MSGISLKTVKHLFAASANRCCHPGCTQEMVTDRGIVIGEICHITASRRGGPRYDPKLTDDERDSFPNLILFCPTHHKMADDDTERYTPALLRDLKEMSARNRLVELTATDLIKIEKLRAAHVTINVGHGSRVRVEHAQEIHAQTVKVPRNMAQADFGLLVAFLQARIRNTKLGRILGAQNNPLLSTYQAWLQKPEKD